MPTSCVAVQNSIDLIDREIGALTRAISDLHLEITERQGRLGSAGPGKAALMKEIGALQQQVNGQEAALRQKATDLAAATRQLALCVDIVRVHAVISSDDVGVSPRRRANITPDEIKSWIDRTNQLFAQARILCVFDKNQDVSEVSNTRINSFVGDDPSDEQRDFDVAPTRREEANRIADQFPARVVIFFRFGPRATPIGGGYSESIDEAPFSRFVMMPGFNDTTTCGVAQNINLLAHELGHYFGLVHTHAFVSTTAQDASNLFVAAGRNPDVFDYDKQKRGITDTDPDPIFSWQELLVKDLACDRSVTRITLPVGDPNPAILQLPRGNVMSYYPDATGFSPQQIAHMRSNLTRRGISFLPAEFDSPHVHDS